MILTNTTSEADKVASYLTERMKASAAAYYASVSKTVVKDFVAGRIKILVVCGSLLEGFDHKPVSIVLILRNVASSVLFTQFVGRCVRKAHSSDPVFALIYAHKNCQLKKYFTEFDRLATTIPVDDMVV